MIHSETTLNDFTPSAGTAATRQPSRPVPACRVVVRKRTNIGAALAAHWLGAAVILAAGTGNALARQDTMAPPPGEQAPNQAPLGGPAVRDKAAPGERHFGEPMNDKGNAKFARRGAPHGAFLRAVGQMEGPLALTEDQESQLRRIESEFRDQMKAFREKNADTFKQLRAEAGMGSGPGEMNAGGEGGRERGRKGGKGPVNREDADPKVKEARAKLKELMQSAPKPDEAQGRQWALLNDGQREFVKQRMEDFKEQGPRAGGERRRGKGGPDAGPGGPKGARGPEDGGPDRPRRSGPPRPPRDGGERPPQMERERALPPMPAEPAEASDDNA